MLVSVGQVVCSECYGQKEELHVVSPWYSGESSDNSAGKHQVLLAIFLPFSLPARIAFSIVRLTFDFRIGLGPVGRYFSMYNTTLGKICTKLGGSELWAIVGNNFMGHSMVHKCGLHAFYDSCRHGTSNDMYFWPSETGIYHDTCFFTGERFAQVGVQDLPWLTWQRRHVNGRWCGYWTLGLTCNACTN